MLPTPNSGQLDAFGEGDFVLPKGRTVHAEGIPARLTRDATVTTHPGNARLMRARRAREGKGPERHSAKAHRCVDKVRAKGHGESNAWAICTASIGKRGVYAKGHGGNANPKRKMHEAGCGTCDGCKHNAKLRKQMREALNREYRKVIREVARGTFEEVSLSEAWSDAARAASIAARRARAMGHNWRKAGRNAFRKAVRQLQGFDVADAFTKAAVQGDTQSFQLLPRGATGAQGILKQARKRAERMKSDKEFWATRKGHISKALTHKGRRFAFA